MSGGAKRGRPRAQQSSGGFYQTSSGPEQTRPVPEGHEEEPTPIPVSHWAWHADVISQEGSKADKLKKLSERKDSGILTEAEFEEQKAKLLESD